MILKETLTDWLRSPTSKGFALNFFMPLHPPPNKKYREAHGK